MSHSIRLRDPWDLTSQPNATGSQLPGTIWHCSRKFNSPTGLDAGQRVSLNLALEHGVTLESLQLNGHSLQVSASAEGFTADIREHLKPFNQVELVLRLSEESNPSHSPANANLPFAALAHVVLQLG